MFCGDQLGDGEVRGGGEGLGVLGGDGMLYGYRIDPESDDFAGIFGQEGYDAERSNVYPIAAMPELPSAGEFLEESSVYAYPNPVRSSTVTIRYHLAEDAEVDMTVYDLAGNKIESWLTSGIGRADNEYIWECGDVASGVYYCRLEAQGTSGENKVVFCPIAIVR